MPIECVHLFCTSSGSVKSEHNRTNIIRLGQMWSALKYDPRVFSTSCSSAFAVAAIARCTGGKRCDCSVLAISINIFTFDCQKLQAKRLCVWIIHIFHPVLWVPFESAKSCAHSSCFTPININSFIWVVIPLAGRVYFFMISHKQMHYNKIWSLRPASPSSVHPTSEVHKHTWMELQHFYEHRMCGDFPPARARSSAHGYIPM